MFIINLFEAILKFFSQVKVYGLILTIFFAWVLYIIVIGLLGKLVLGGKTELEKKRKKTLVNLLGNISKYLIIVIAILVTLEIYGINTAKAVAGLGVVGVVVGFALQDTLKDFISGISIIMDNYFVVGDIVEYNSFKGEVISLGLRSTKIKKATGEVLTFANRNLTEVINFSQKKASIVINIPIAFEEKSAKIEKVLKELIPEINKISNVIGTGATYLGITSIGESSIIHSISINCDRLTQYQVNRDALRVIKDGLDNAKIKIPYKKMEVYNGK